MSSELTRATEDETTLTLAFSEAAIEALADPGAAVEDARRWSENVGFVSDEPAHEVLNRIRKYDIYDEDFYPEFDRGDTLGEVRLGTDTDRYVYVGTTPADADLAETWNWEFLTVEAAAQAAEWELDATRTL